MLRHYTLSGLSRLLFDQLYRCWKDCAARLCCTLLKMVTLSYHSSAMSTAMAWHLVGMGMQHQVSSLTFPAGMHTLGNITACLFCQFGFDSCVCCREEVTFWERSFQWDKKITFLVGYFECTHERLDLYDQKSCLLPLIIGYWAIGIAILSKVIFIQRRLGSVEIRQRLRSELLMWSFGKTFFMKYLVSLYWTDKSVTYFWGDVFFFMSLQMLQTEKHAVM